MLHHEGKRGSDTHGPSEIDRYFDSIIYAEEGDTSWARMVSKKDRSVGATGRFGGAIISREYDEHGRLQLLATDIAPDEKVDRNAAHRNLWREKIYDALENTACDITETALLETCGVANRDKELFQALLAELVADESNAIGVTKRGKGHYYKLTEMEE